MAELVSKTILRRALAREGPRRELVESIRRFGFGRTSFQATAMKDSLSSSKRRQAAAKSTNDRLRSVTRGGEG